MHLITITYTAFLKIMKPLSLVIVVSSAILLSGCATETEPITEANYEEEEFAHFVEPDFPFITTSLDARGLGQGFPVEKNITARALALRLGEEAYACFDTDMLRWTVAWTGDFMPMNTMAQISYRDFFNKKNQMPVIAGKPKIATGVYPGWSGAEPQFEDPRAPSRNPDGPSWGPLPQDMGRWNGVYLAGDQVVMSYTVRGSQIYELPGSVKIKEETGFTRTLNVGKPLKGLSMIVAEVTDGVRNEISDNTAFIYNGSNEDSVTAIGVVSDASGVGVNIKENRYATIRIPASNENLKFTVVMWRGPASQRGIFKQMVEKAETELPDFRDGSDDRWDKTVVTRGKTSPDTAAYVTDILTLPVPNPWRRNVRVVDVGFFDDSRAALVTFEGDVWIVEGIDRRLRKLKWRRYASGLYEPQSLEVVQDTVYVFGKEGIVRFHDLNRDGVADYYENFSNVMEQSIESREWAAGMVAAPDGGFYISKFGALNGGPETSSPNIFMGFRAGSYHDGSILKVSKDGRSVETYATGFRGPYIGVHPETGVVSASDQQGNYVPSTPVRLVKKGDYFGVPATAHADTARKITPPLTWIPHSVDRSGMSQIWITSGRMGPINDEMVHISYGRPGLFRVLMDSVDNVVQGAVAVIPGYYPGPTMKSALNPEDGQLYIAGFSLFGASPGELSAFIRVRYTGEESLMPEKFQVREGGVMIRFATELDEETASDLNNYHIKRWNYLRSPKYGSGHYKPDGTAGEESLPVLGAYLSDDRRAVFVVVPDMKEVMQMELSYNIRSASGTVMDDALWFTVKNVAKPDFLAQGFSNINVEELLADADSKIAMEGTAEKPSAELGMQLFRGKGCVACHSTDNESAGRLAPGLKGLYGSERSFTDGSSTVANEDYIREAILKPAEKIVKGYDDEGMPSFMGILSDRDIESMTLYIKEL